MTLKTISNSFETTHNIGKAIGKAAFGGMVILLNADLGCGKTLMTKGIAKGMNIDEMVKSPTYTLVQTYDGNYKLNHFDLYRIDTDDDFYDIGGYEYLTNDAVCVFEWPGAVDWQDYDRLEIIIKYIDENTRSIECIPYGIKYEKWLNNIKESILNIVE